MKVLAVIPARYHSRRFPGKPLTLIDGKTMIRRVYEQACKSELVDYTIVATDDNRICQEVQSFQGRVMMTRSNHRSGTDRCAEVAKSLSGFEIIINIQGDEPFIQPDQITALAHLLTSETDTHIATLIKKIDDTELLFSPHVVKVVRSKTNRALYFSRSPIPYLRDIATKDWLNHHTFYKHLGMYGFRRKALLEITQLEDSSLEISESLEQLRWLENGFDIKLSETDIESPGIDTPADLSRIEAFLAGNKK